MRISLTLNQRIYSKKNSRRFIMRGGKRFSIPSAAYERFQKSAIKELQAQYDPDTEGQFLGLISVITTLYIPGKLGTTVDADNLHTSILDVLQAAKIISDDKNVVEGYYEKQPTMGKTWMADITIADWPTQ